MKTMIKPLRKLHVRPGVSGRPVLTTGFFQPAPHHEKSSLQCTSILHKTFANYSRCYANKLPMIMMDWNASSKCRQGS